MGTNLKSDLSKENDEKLTMMYIELHTLFKDLCILKRFSRRQQQVLEPVSEGEGEEEHWLLGQHISTGKVVALLKEQVSQLKTTINTILMSQVLDSGLIKSGEDLATFKEIILLENQGQKSLVQVRQQYEKELSGYRSSHTELKLRNKQLE